MGTEVRTADETPPVILAERGNAKTTYANGNGKSAPDAASFQRAKNCIILVHGFQGCSFDMRSVKNQLCLEFPETQFLLSNSNENNTDVAFEEMGSRLANEVKAYIAEQANSSRSWRLGTLSFIAHSFGGLIVRAALPHLCEFRDNLYSFITLGTMHLGFPNASKIIENGAWLVKNMRKSRCLEEILLEDCLEDPRQTFLYKSSMREDLGFFKHLCFITSVEDQYAPFESARIQLSDEAVSRLPDNLQALYQDMETNLLRTVRPDGIVRFDVHFCTPPRSLDTLIGRHAHIQFLECNALVQMLAYHYAELFRPPLSSPLNGVVATPRRESRSSGLGFKVPDFVKQKATSGSEATATPRKLTGSPESATPVS